MLFLDGNLYKNSRIKIYRKKFSAETGVSSNRDLVDVLDGSGADARVKQGPVACALAAANAANVCGKSTSTVRVARCLGKNVPKNIKYTKWPQNIPNNQKIYRMATKYTKSP
jgi:hypothetical protein